MRTHPRTGDRVRHREGGWYATVSHVRLNTIVVTAEENRHYDGEYSTVVFEVVEEG